MQFEKHKNGFSIWYGKSKTGIGVSKTFQILFYFQHWKVFGVKHNGAIKGKDRCLDVSFWVLGFCFNFINWEYDQ